MLSMPSMALHQVFTRRVDAEMDAMGAAAWIDEARSPVPVSWSRGDGVNDAVVKDETWRSMEIYGD